MAKPELSYLPEAGLKTIAFAEFINQVFPQVRNHPRLLQKAEALVAGLSGISELDEDRSFAYVRGGSMRTFLYQTQIVEKDISLFYSNLPPDLKGSNPLTSQVMIHAFGLKDIDIHIRRDPHTRHNDKKTKEIIEKLAALNGYQTVIDIQTAGNKSFFHIKKIIWDIF